MEEEVCLYQKFGFCKYRDHCSKRHLEEECQNLSNCISKKSCAKRHPKLCREYVLHRRCPYGDKCDYLHKEHEKSQEEIKMNTKLEELEKLVKDKNEGEMKMELAVKKLENVLKVMTRKVINLEEELLSVKEILKNSSLDTTKEGLGHQESGKENVNVLKGDISKKDFNPKSASSPKVKDKVKKGEEKELFFTCSKCNYKSKKEALLKKHMLTKHEDHNCKECQEKFQSLMELLNHVAKHHVNEKDEVNLIKDRGGEAVKKEINQEKANEEDSDEVQRTKIMKNKGKDKSFVFSESQFFNEFL